MILRNLRKEYHDATKPSIDFINKLLNDAYDSGMHYDVTDLRPSIMSFAASSSHQAEYCLKLVQDMKYKSDDCSEPVDAENDAPYNQLYFISTFTPNSLAASLAP